MMKTKSGVGMLVLLFSTNVWASIAGTLNLTGTWIDPAGDSIVVTQTGDTLSMKYANGRGPFTGKFTAARALSTTFDATCCTATLPAGDDNTINWSNSGTWKRLAGSVRGQDKVVVASSTGNWTDPKITLHQFTPTDFKWSNFYQECGGYEAYHPQHVIRLPNDKAGNAYFMVTQSREHNGYMTLLMVDAVSIDKTTDALISTEPISIGRAVWQDAYTGAFNGTINPIGNWNHPCKMSYIDGVLAVAAQNWLIRSVCRVGYDKLPIGNSEDAVIFYDLRNISSPKYLGSMTASQLGVPNRELATVELAYSSAANKYLLFAGGDGKFSMLSAHTFSPRFGDWTKVSNLPTRDWSGQHGLTFEATSQGKTKLWFFDVSGGEGGGSFKFTPFEHSANSPYLLAGTQQSISVKLPGAKRDWDTGSIYISPITRKPIVYSVKSLSGTKNYQLYQVLPKD